MQLQCYAIDEYFLYGFSISFIEIIMLVSLVSKPKFCPVITYKAAYFLQRLSCRWDQNELSQRTKIKNNI